MLKFANPARFMRLSSKILPFISGAAFALIALGLYLGLFNSPPDYQQGETVRIMYVHVPSAWMGMFVYANMAIASAVALVWKHPLAEIAAKASAPVGAGFTLVCLITGALWGKPMWGTWWVWDARLTSMLILLFLYMGYMALVDAFDDPTRGMRSASILALVGSVNIPIIKFSVDWWNTLHQPASVVRAGMPLVDKAMLIPLLLMIVGFTLYYFAILFVRMRSELMAAKIRAARFRNIEMGE